jgi:hypothetical protein
MNKMPEIKEVPFLKGDEIETGTETVLTFIAPHEEIPAEESGLDRELAQILVELDGGKRRIWTMNKTAQRMLAGLLGANSAPSTPCHKTSKANS